MKKYLLCVLLAGNFIRAMDDPKNPEKVTRLGELIVKINAEAMEGHERQALASQIICLRQELGIKELYQDLPLGSYSNRPEPRSYRLPGLPSDETPAYDQISTMNQEQLTAFQEKLVAQEGTISPFIQGQIKDRFEQLKFQEAWKAELSAPEAAAVERAASSRKVHVPSDSSGSGISRSCDDSELAAVAKPIAREPLAPISAEADQDSGSDSDMPTLERVPQDQHAGEVAGESHDTHLTKQNPATPKVSEVPAPFTADDFVDALAPDDDFKGSTDAQPVPEVIIGKDAQPVVAQVHPLAAAPSVSLDQHPALASPQSPAPEQRDTPSVQAAAVAPADASDLESAGAKKTDTYGDAQLAQKQLTADLAAEHARTPGGPDDGARLPVEPVAGKDGKAFGGPATFEEAKKAAGVPDVAQKEDEQTPGGPDDENACQEPDLGDEASADRTRMSNLHKGVVAAAVVALVYGTAETVVAYRSISHHEWKQACGMLNKAKLVMGKTWENVRKRPSQVMHLAKQVPAAGSSLLQKLKGVARAA